MLYEKGYPVNKQSTMSPSRLEAFSDGVIAIIITIMVLELKVPPGDSLESLRPLMPVLLGYALSFIYVGIYWNNHHHMIHTCHHVTGQILWANLHLLFWLSLFPFATGWAGQNHFSAAPAFLYGIILLMAAVAYYTLQRTIIASQGQNSPLQKAIGNDWKGKASPVIYLIALLLSGWHSEVSYILYVLVAFVWVIPDRRIENAS